MKIKHLIAIAISVATLLNIITFTTNCRADNTDTLIEVMPIQQPSNERQAELIHLLKQDCGSCHGMTLKGGLGPPLLPKNLVDKPDYVLLGVIKYGRETLAMPAWDGILTTAEIEWLVAQLKQGIE